MSELVAICGLSPSVLPVYEPMSVPCPYGLGTESAISRILSAATEVCSRWYKVVNAAFSREKQRRVQFRKDNGLPFNAKIEPGKLILTEEEKSIVSLMEAVVRSMFGDAADYVRDSFSRTLESGDRRSFKIRLLFYRFRDSLDDPDMKARFEEGMEDAITDCERMAGCESDPSPRRLSRAEQERKRIKEERERALGVQMDMFMDMPEGGWFEHSLADEVHESRPEAHIQPQVQPQAQPQMQPRKTREYRSVQEISDDIEAGLIVPYEDMSEVVKDMRLGVLSPSEACMFIAQIEHRRHDDSEKLEQMTEKASISIEDGPDESDIEDVSYDQPVPEASPDCDMDSDE